MAGASARPPSIRRTILGNFIGPSSLLDTSHPLVTTQPASFLNGEKDFACGKKEYYNFAV